MASKTLTTLTAVLQMNNSKFKKGVKGSQKQLTSFQKQVRKVGGMVAGAFAISAVTNFAKSSFRALDTQRKAEAALLTALKGKEQIQQSLIAQAKSLQKITLFGDEETIRAQSLIAAFTNEEETIKRLIPLVQDFATAKAMDLAGAADLVSKTIGSSTNALSRYGIEVVGAVGSTERLDSLVRGLSNAFAGQAKAAADADVSLTQLKNQFGDLKENMAAIAVSGPVVMNTITTLRSDHISKWDKFLSLFSVQKGIEVQSIALAMDELTRVSPGGVAGFDFGPDTGGGGGGGGGVPRLLGIDPMEADAVLGKVGEGFEFVRDKVKVTIDAVREGREEFDYLNSTLETFQGVTVAAVVPALKETITAADALKATLKDIGQGIMMELINNVHSLGVAMGEAMGGMEGSLKSLGAQILANIGYMLMMAGLYLLPLNPAAGVGLMLAGGAIQLGTGIFKGRENAAAKLGRNDGGGDLRLRVEGRDLVTVLQRQDYSNNLNT